MFPTEHIKTKTSYNSIVTRCLVIFGLYAYMHVCSVFTCVSAWWAQTMSEESSVSEVHLLLQTQFFLARGSIQMRKKCSSTFQAAFCSPEFLIYVNMWAEDTLHILRKNQMGATITTTIKRNIGTRNIQHGCVARKWNETKRDDSIWILCSSEIAFENVSICFYFVTALRCCFCSVLSLFCLSFVLSFYLFF